MILSIFPNGIPVEFKHEEEMARQYAELLPSVIYTFVED